MKPQGTVKERALEARTSGRTATGIACLLLTLLLLVFTAMGMTGCTTEKGSVTILHSEGGTATSQLSTGGTRTIADVVDMVADTVVEINCTVEITSQFWGRPVTQRGTSAGSGVILSADGTIVTNHHVIDNAIDISVRLHNNTIYSATLVDSDAAHDIAVLKVNAENLAYATFGDSSALRVGQPVVVIGNPLGTLGGTVTDGIISALDRDITVEGTTMRLLQTNAAINSGNSGGGMFDLDGRLVGIVNAKSTGDDVEGLGFAIPSNTALEVVTELLSR